MNNSDVLTYTELAYILALQGRIEVEVVSEDDIEDDETQIYSDIKLNKCSEEKIKKYL